MKLFIGFIIIALALLCVLLSLVNAEISEATAIINRSSSNDSDSMQTTQQPHVTTNKPETSTFVLAEELNATETPNEDIAHLVAANVALASRMAILENRLRTLEQLLVSVNHDVHFHHPTVEIQFVDMQVVQWENALENGLRNVAIPFQAGFSIGAISSWEFSLDNENDAVTANLLLLEERYNRGAIFAGFTAFVLDNTGNVYSEAYAAPVNLLDGSSRTLHLPNIISLDEIRNSSNGLMEGGVFRIRFRLELLGVGHKLYSGVVRQ
ncbi:unnamed protein product [Orchesella dallaii]|uniref:Uncharacterized protein n=1 Tax=Orchesella dallaii TaxID=48710 RepID=A0ABP1QS35_9HEXA